MSSFIILILFDFDIDLVSVLTGVVPFVQVRSASSKVSKSSGPAGDSDVDAAGKAEADAIA